MALFDIMSRPIVTVAPDTKVSDAASLARERKIHHLVVMADEVVAGVLCACDLRGAAPGSVVSDCMSTSVETVSVNESPDGAAERMRARHVGCLPVTAGALLLGIITVDDLRRAGIGLDEMGRSSCAACGSRLHVRATRHDPDGSLCLYCRERSVEVEESLDAGG